MKTTKPFDIPKASFARAYRLVKANAGSAGVDRQSLKDFEKRRDDELYKLWNRMSSGCYHPPAVKTVRIPKKTGGTRTLGIPTVADRIAQMVVKQELEPMLELHFHKDSYGYRPNKSALDAIAVTRERCWRYDWVLEFDIQGLFDHIPHDLLMKAVKRHTPSKWILLYVKRWLQAPIQDEDGEERKREAGVPQGGVISPLLSNLFMHYAFDRWMTKVHPGNPWCRYADDALIHGRTETEVQAVLKNLKARLAHCGLTLHPQKTKIVYCQDDNRRKRYPETQFEFLGYSFRRRRCKNSKTGQLFCSFTCAVSRRSIVAMRRGTRALGWRKRTDVTLEEIAKWYNPILMGWLNYYGRYHGSAMYPVWRHVNLTLIKWAMRKYKVLRGRKTRASRFIRAIARREPSLFVHWKIGMKGSFA